MTSISTLRPGLLVSLKTSVTGNVQYHKEIIEAERVTEAGAALVKWETERSIADPAEHERATKVQSNGSAVIRRICQKTAFGLLCPEERAEELQEAIAKARQMADDFNKTAKLSRVSIDALTGRIAPDDVQAVKAINKEVRELMDLMESGIGTLDVKRIRDAAYRAKEIGAMLSPDSEARIRIAIDTAREAANRINKAGEQMAMEVDRAAIRKITECRTAFLDLDEPKAEAAKPKAKARAVDLSPEAAPSKPKRAAKARALELE